MKSEEEIKNRIVYCEGYIAGQENSIERDKEKIEKTVNIIGTLKWVLDEEE